MLLRSYWSSSLERSNGIAAKGAGCDILEPDVSYGSVNYIANGNWYQP